MTEEEFKEWDRKVSEPFESRTEDFKEHPLVKLQLAASEEFWRSALGDEGYEERQKFLAALIPDPIVPND